MWKTKTTLKKSFIHYPIAVLRLIALINWQLMSISRPPISQFYGPPVQYTILIKGGCHVFTFFILFLIFTVIITSVVYSSLVLNYDLSWSTRGCPCNKKPCQPQGTHMFLQKLKTIWFSAWPAIADIYIYVFNEQRASL